MYLKLIEDERGIDPAQYKSDIIWPMLALRMLARDKIQITRQDIDQAMENEFGPTVKVRMIAVKDLAKAQQLHQQAMADPASFKQLAKMHSEDAMSASVEGLLQPIRRFSGMRSLRSSPLVCNQIRFLKSSTSLTFTSSCSVCDMSLQPSQPRSDTDH